MSTKLYHAKNQITAGRRVEIVAQMCNFDLQNVYISGPEFKQQAHFKRHPFGKVPAMQTPEGNLFESCSLMRYIARKTGKMYGGNPMETAQIDQWLQFFNTQFQTVMTPIYRTTFGYMIYPKQKFDDAIKQIHELIKIVDSALQNSPYLGSKELSIADVALALQFRIVMRLYINQKVRNGAPHFTKWFNQVNSHPVIAKKYGRIWLCQKQFVPDFTFGKEAPKKEAKQDKQENAKKQQKQQPKKQKQVKKEQKKTQKKVQKKKEQVKQEQQQPKAQKKKNPLDELPASTFNIDDWKREFVNSEDPKVAIKQFWEKFDPVGWSIWKSHYVRYEGEGKVGYLTKNLKDGYLRNIDHFRKYCFSVLGVYGVEGDYNIDGVWLWRGTEIPNQWKEHMSYDYFEFTKLDHTNEAHRKMTEEYWTCLNQGDMVDGHPLFQAKWFK